MQQHSSLYMVSICRHLQKVCVNYNKLGIILLYVDISDDDFYMQHQMNLNW